MNCEKYQDLLSGFIDGSLIPEEHNRVEAHLSDCGVCAEARSDLDAIVVFCRENRGEYDAVPNERALWLRISNTIERDLTGLPRAVVKVNAGWWSRLMNQSWQLSFPRLAASAAMSVVIPKLPWPEGKVVLEKLSGSPVLFVLAAAENEQAKSGAMDFLLDPARFTAALERASGDDLRAALRRY